MKVIKIIILPFSFETLFEIYKLTFSKVTFFSFKNYTFYHSFDSFYHQYFHWYVLQLRYVMSTVVMSIVFFFISSRLTSHFKEPNAKHARQIFSKSGKKSVSFMGRTALPSLTLDMGGLNEKKNNIKKTNLQALAFILDNIKYVKILIATVSFTF